MLRCLVEDDENGQLVVGIDDQELSLEEFGRMLTTYAGWGMRIEFVPDDQLHRRPALEVRETRSGKRVGGRVKEYFLRIRSEGFLRHGRALKQGRFAREAFGLPGVGRRRFVALIQLSLGRLLLSRAHVMAVNR